MRGRVVFIYKKLLDFQSVGGFITLNALTKQNNANLLVLDFKETGINFDKNERTIPSRLYSKGISYPF